MSVGQPARRAQGARRFSNRRISPSANIDAERQESLALSRSRSRKPVSIRSQLTDLYSRIVTAHIFDGLYRYDHLARPFKIKPCTADGMPEVSDDFRIWTVRLKPGIYFQDDPAFKGKRRELIAQDYVYSWKRFFDPRWKSPAFASLSELKMVGMAALRDAALKGKQAVRLRHDSRGHARARPLHAAVQICRAQPRFIQVHGDISLFGAVAREVVEAYGDHDPGSSGRNRPVSPGRVAPFVRIVLERNPTYREVVYDAEPNADDVEGQASAAEVQGPRCR